MRPLPASEAVRRFSTAALPEKHRVEFLCEEVGRAHFSAELTPVPGVPFACSAAVWRLPGISLLVAQSDGIQVARTPRLLADGNDDLLLNVNAKGRVHTSHMGREALRRPGGAILISASDAAVSLFPEPVKYISVSLPRAALRAMIRDPEAAIMKPIPEDSEPLRLLKAYVSVLESQMETFPEAAVAHAIAEHILDLAVLTLGATKDSAGLAKDRGLRAARLCAIKTDIVRNLCRNDLSVSTIAGRHGVTARHVQSLFETEGTTFSEFVLAQRLARVHRRLVDGRFADQTIGDIVGEAGLTGSSYFNRVFRRRYGAAPSGIRAAVLNGASELV